MADWQAAKSRLPGDDGDGCGSNVHVHWLRIILCMAIRIEVLMPRAAFKGKDCCDRRRFEGGRRPQCGNPLRKRNCTRWECRAPAFAGSCGGLLNDNTMACVSEAIGWH